MYNGGCLKGQGHNLDSEYTIEIPISGRKPLSVRIIKTSRIFQTSEGEIPYYGYYAYWFVGQSGDRTSGFSWFWYLDLRVESYLDVGV